MSVNLLAVDHWITIIGAALKFAIRTEEIDDNLSTTGTLWTGGAPRESIAVTVTLGWQP